MFNPFGKSAPQVSADDVNNAINNKEDVTILDVRTPGEYSRGKIEGSINIPIDEIGSKIEEAFPDKDRKIYAYCLSGSRSDVVVDEMVKMGYKNVFSMTSGLLAWRVKKFKLVE